MDYFAGLDISMDETHVCVLLRRRGGSREQGGVDGRGDCGRIGEAAKLSSDRIRDRNAWHRSVPRVEPTRSSGGLRGEPAGLPGAQVAATHKTDRNDARGLAHLARTGVFKPVHVKSFSAHAVRSLIIARKKLVGHRVTLENQIRGLAVVFGIRLPRALTAAAPGCPVANCAGVVGATRGRLNVTTRPRDEKTVQVARPWRTANLAFFSARIQVLLGAPAT